MPPSAGLHAPSSSREQRQNSQPYPRDRKAAAATVLEGGWRGRALRERGVQKLARIPPTSIGGGNHPADVGGYGPGLAVDAERPGRGVVGLTLGRPMALAVCLADDEFQYVPTAPAEVERTVEGGQRRHVDHRARRGRNHLRGKLLRGECQLVHPQTKVRVKCRSSHAEPGHSPTSRSCIRCANAACRQPQRRHH